MADIQTKFTLRANAEGFDQARRQVSGLNDAMSKVAATQAKMAGASGRIGGIGSQATMGGGGKRGAGDDAMSVLLGRMGGSSEGRNNARDSNSLLNLVKRLEQAQRHAGDTAVEGLKKEADAANKTADALNRRNKARGGGGAGGTGGGGGGGGGPGGPGDGDGEGGGRFGKYRKSFGLGVMQKVSGIDFLQGGMQGVAQMMGGMAGNIAMSLLGSVKNAVGGLLSTPTNVLTQGSGAITSLAQSMPLSGLYAGGVQQNVDFGTQEIQNQRSLSGLLPYVTGNRLYGDAGDVINRNRRRLSGTAQSMGLNPNEAFSSLASAVAGSGGILDDVTDEQQRNMLALNKLGVSDLGTSASIMRSQQRGYIDHTARRKQYFNPTNDPLVRGQSDAADFNLKGSEAQNYLRTIAEGMQSVVHTGIRFNQEGRADAIRAVMANSHSGFQQAQGMQEGFRAHLRQVSLMGPQSAEDMMLLRARHYNPEKGPQDMARALAEIGDERNLPQLTSSYLRQARGISNLRGGAIGDIQMAQLMGRVGMSASSQQGRDFRRNDHRGEKRVRTFMPGVELSPGSSSQKISEAAGRLVPDIVRPSVLREAQGMETGINLAPDVQSLDAKQAEYNRQLLGTSKAFAELAGYLSDFSGKLTGLGLPPAQSRPMSMAP